MPDHAIVGHTENRLEVCISVLDDWLQHLYHIEFAFHIVNISYRCPDKW